MDLRNVKPGDRVEVNIKGRVFAAAFRGVEGPRALVEPESARITYRLVKKTQIIKRLETT
jgi:hypothetical protein